MVKKKGEKTCYLGSLLERLGFFLHLCFFCFRAKQEAISSVLFQASLLYVATGHSCTEVAHFEYEETSFEEASIKREEL